jgi:hypothetical protein
LLLPQCLGGKQRGHGQHVHHRQLQHKRRLQGR